MEIKREENILKKTLMGIMIIMAGIVPLVMYMRIDDLKGQKSELWRVIEVQADIFSLIKSEMIIVFGSILIVILMYLFISKKYKIKLESYHKIVLIFGLLILLSSLFSKYIYISFNGFTTRYEGFWVYLMYITLFIVASFVFSKIEIVKIIFFVLISGVIMGIIGISQFYGFDILNTNFIKLLMLPKNYKYLADEFIFVFVNKEIYGTLFNPNYMGSYGALLLPLSVGYYLNEINNRKRIFIGIFSCGLLVFSLLGSFSRAGYFGIIIAFIVFLIFSIKQIKKHNKSKQIIHLAIYFILIVIIMNLTKANMIYDEFKNLDTVTGIEGTVNAQISIDDIIVNGKNINIKIPNIDLKIEKIEERLYFFDGDTSIVIKQEGNKISFKDDKYKNIYLLLGEGNGKITAVLGDKSFDFYYTDQGIRFLNVRGEFVEFENADSFMRNILERFFAARGYIWSKTLPLLKETLLLGKGPDTFIAYFPQEDVGEKMNTLNPTIIVDKPHNYYLLLFFNSGMISLIAFLLLIFNYLKKTKKSLKINNDNNKSSFIEIGILSGIMGFLASLVFNDSYIGIMPIFWFMLGAGFSLNSDIFKGNKIKKTTSH